MKKTNIAILTIALLLSAGGSVLAASKFNPKQAPPGGGRQDNNRIAINQTFDNGDYTAWKNLMGDNPITEKITADNFAKFAEAHKLMLAGQTDEAQKIMTELGLDHGFGMGMMKNGRGLKNGFRHGQEQSDQ